jgi:4a-hydroxytetrahydrobiopterin dehydratase
MKLNDQDIQTRVAGLTGWAVEGNALVRTYTFQGFPDAVAFVARLAFDAEAADHHPDLTITYKRVRVAWSTHSDGGISDKDFAGATHSDEVALKFTPK